MIQMLETHSWNKDDGYESRSMILQGIVGYLCGQMQDKLPYSVPYVDSNDTIFIGNAQFRDDGNQLANYCFGKLMEFVTAMNENKAGHEKHLFDLCMSSANLVVAHTDLSVKKMSGAANNFFKLSDGFLVAYNNRPDVKGKCELNRNWINSTVYAMRKKKEQAMAAGGGQ
jgi:hypothetical protein